MMVILKHAIVFLTVYLLLQVDGKIEDSKCRGISRGKEFVLGFTSNFEPRSGELHVLVVAFSDNPTTVTISSRYKSNGMNYQVTFVLPPGGYRRTTIPFDFRLNDRSVRSNKVLSVVASSDVTVYGANYEQFTTDAFLSLPTNQLGLHYVVVSSRQPSFSPILAVIGLVDNTNVHITLTAAAFFEDQNYEAGDVLSFVVDRHEIVQILGNAGTDLSGTIVRSDNAIAAIGGHQCASTPGSTCDTLIEQLIPVDSWGTSHIFTATGSQTDHSIYKIAVFFEDTVVTVPGMGNRSLNAGEIWEVSMPGSGVITSTLPSSVTQILRSIDGVLVDPSIIQVPSEEQFAFKFGFATPPKSSGDSSGFFNFMNIVVKAEECSTVILNGQRIQCNGTTAEIPGTEYVVLTQSLPKSEQAYFVEGAPGSSPMSVIVYGYEDDETYGYAAGLSLPNEGRLLSVSPFIVNENGGNILTITLPCLERNIPAADNVVCRFCCDTSVHDVAGVLDDFYQVRCPTYIFSHVGFTSIDVSLDGGDTFPYSGTIYVASRYDLPPKVKVSGLTPEFALVDLTAIESNVTIIWDPMDFPDTIYVTLGIFVEDPAESIGWSEEILLESRVPNNGQYELKSTILDRADVLFDEQKRSIVSSVFFVMPHRPYRVRRYGLLDYVKAPFIYIGFFVDLITVSFSGGCEQWTDELKKGYERLKNLPPCPPTLNLAQIDTRYTESSAGISIYHAGADACFRRDAANGAGTQCCYGAQGELLLGPPGGGTADAYAPGPFGSSNHSRFDVKPWTACCYGDWKREECERYHKYRPAINSEGYVRPRTARATGDPHFITLDQHEYTFNAAGEFTLLQSELHDITFQGRMEQIPGLNASVFSAFVLRGESVPKLQIQRTSMNQTLVLRDNKELKLTHEGITLPKFTIGGGVDLKINPDQTKLVVRMPFGLAITFMVLSDMMSYNVDLEDKFRGQTRGLLGNFNGDPDDDLSLPNGDVLPNNSSLREIHYNFGLKWMVNKSESIFTYMQADDFESYNRPEFVPSFDIPDPNDIDPEIIDLCGSSVQCLFDAVNTGSLSFANGTLSDIQEYYEKRDILRKIVKCGFPRDLVNGKTENIVYYVNSSYIFHCEDGFTLVGDATGYCGAGGTWTTKLPSCVEMLTYTRVWLILAAFLVLSVVVLLVISCVRKICRSSRRIV